MRFTHLLQIDLPFYQYKFALLCFVSSFIVTLLAIPPIITLINRYKLYDVPNARKLHSSPIPTMGGIAIVAGMLTGLVLWFPFHFGVSEIAFFFSIIALLALGIMDDLRDLPARYKFMIQFGVASLVAVSGIRITSFDGLFGIGQLPLVSQYTLTVLAIVGITNAFNLIDGIDGLAGGLAFMSLITLGLFLTISGDVTTALIAFALAGGILAFLYFNFNPAKIFMGDTGSLVIGFVIAVLAIRLLQVNVHGPAVVTGMPMIIIGTVLIPVFDTLRVFAVRIYHGRSPFAADKIHIHHLLTNNGFSHSFSARVICMLHALILLEVYLLRHIRQELLLALSAVFMILASRLLSKARLVKQLRLRWLRTVSHFS